MRGGPPPAENQADQRRATVAGGLVILLVGGGLTVLVRHEHLYVATALALFGVTSLAVLWVGGLLANKRLRGVSLGQRDRETHWRDSLAHLADGVVVVEGEGQIVFANPAASTLLGVDSLREKTMADFIGPVAGDDVLAGSTRAGSLVLDAEGNRRMLEYRATSMGNRTWVYTFHDGSRQLGMLKDAKETVARLRELADAMPLLVWETNAAGQLEFGNVRLEDALFRELPQGNFMEALSARIAAREQDAFKSAWSVARTDARRWQVEVRLGLLDGSQKWHLVAEVPRRDTEGEVIGWYGTAVDIHALKESERLAVRANDRLEESNRELEEFAYVASHDLKEPLRTISGFLQLIERRYGEALDDDGREFIQFSVDGVTRLQELIDSLLMYSRVTTKARGKQSVDLDTATQRVLEALSAQIADTHATVEVAPLGRVWGDPFQMEQLLQNLVSNSMKFAGDSPPRVLLRADDRGDWKTLVVQDHGVGFDNRFGDKVFRVFQRLQRNKEGTGIGLAICKKIVQRHGGKIEVDSAPGKGAMFTIQLPMNEEGYEQRHG